MADDKNLGVEAGVVYEVQTFGGKEVGQPVNHLQKPVKPGIDTELLKKLLSARNIIDDGKGQGR